MSTAGQSPRRHDGIDSLDRLLTDFDLRITMRERNYIGHRDASGVGVTAVPFVADLPTDPTPGDRALVIGTGQVYTANASGTWAQGGTIP